MCTSKYVRTYTLHTYVRIIFAENEGGDGSSILIIVVVVILILLYCCLVFLFFYFYTRKEKHYQDKGTNYTYMYTLEMQRYIDILPYRDTLSQ